MLKQNYIYIYVYKELLIIHIKWSTNISCYANAVADVEKEKPPAFMVGI